MWRDLGAQARAVTPSSTLKIELTDEGEGSELYTEHKEEMDLLRLGIQEKRLLWSTSTSYGMNVTQMTKGSQNRTAQSRKGQQGCVCQVQAGTSSESQLLACFALTRVLTSESDRAGKCRRCEAGRDREESQTGGKGADRRHQAVCGSGEVGQYAGEVPHRSHDVPGRGGAQPEQPSVRTAICSTLLCLDCLALHGRV